MFGREVDRGDIGLKDAIAIAFDTEYNRQMWREVGIIPFTRKCLLNDQVKNEIVVGEDGEIDFDADPNAFVLHALKQKNKAAVKILKEFGYKRKNFFEEGSLCGSLISKR